jgi:hypothetical protein
MRKLTIFVLLAVALLPSRLLGQCGVERWQIKTGTDSDAGSVNLNVSTPNSIASLTALAKPSSIPPTSRIQPTETTLWLLNATLTEFKLEGDSDIHLVLVDETGNSMIAEIPDASCVGSGSPFASGISNARAQFTSQFTPGSSFQTVNVPVQIIGIGMFDFLHGQTGVAPNGIELHPVLNIVFNSNSNPNPDFSITSSPPSVLLNTGTSANVSVSLTALAGFNSPVSLSVSGAPPGITATFNPSMVTPTGTGMLVLAADASVSPGNYSLVVNGSGGGNSHSVAVNVTVATTGPGDFSVSTGLGMLPGASASAMVWTSVSGGFNSDISLSAHNLPTGISATFSPTTISAPGAGSSTIVLATDPAIPPGTYAINITATSAAATHSAALGVAVRGASNSLRGLFPTTRGATEGKELQSRTTSATELRDDDDASVSFVPTESFLQKARRHRGGVLCGPRQRHIFLGKAWTDTPNLGRKAALSSLDVVPGPGLCATSHRLPPTNQTETTAFTGNARLSDLGIQAQLARMLKDGHLKVARNTIYVVFLPPGVQSTVGSAVGARDYLAYHRHFHSDYGEVHYVVVPFSADVQLEKRAAARSILETSLNPEGQW